MIKRYESTTRIKRPTTNMIKEYMTLIDKSAYSPEVAKALEMDNSSVRRVLLDLTRSGFLIREKTEYYVDVNSSRRTKHQSKRYMYAYRINKGGKDKPEECNNGISENKRVDES